MSDMEYFKYDILQPTINIYSGRCAAYLVQKGHKILYTKPDKRKAGKEYYVFSNSISINDDVRAYIAKNKRDNERRNKQK